eukprot:CAMPEP_0180215212 /NCGR_PEP_ID=MMETSP0987-20121128/15373_1 /TAXON_ID=697907 /ORGANISM="non described non described, Strain CCMP2293" /LENGTH=45 /DNA_ID= /DNA_START= /DNA_END= /DNA_ORIENTATION=
MSSGQSRPVPRPSKSSRVPSSVLADASRVPPSVLIPQVARGSKLT